METEEQRALLESIKTAMNRPDPPKKLWIRPESKDVIDHAGEHHIDYVLSNWKDMGVAPSRMKEITGRLPRNPADWKTDDIIDIEPDVFRAAMAVGWVRAGWDDEGVAFFQHCDSSRLVQRAMKIYLRDYPEVAHEYDFRVENGMESVVLEGTEIFDYADHGVIPTSTRKIGL